MNKFAALLVVLVIVVGAAIGAWFYFAGEIRRNVELLALNDGETAPRLTCGALDVGGFPFRFDLLCADAAVETGDLLVEIPRLEATALVYRPMHIIGKAFGPATLSDAFSGARNELRWTDLDASLRFTGDRVERFSAVATEIDWLDTLVGEAMIAEASELNVQAVDVPERFNADTGAAALAILVETKNLAAPGQQIADGAISVQAELDGLHPAMLAATQTDALRLWQQLGGTLNLVSLSATDGETALSADGEVTLADTGLADGQMRVQSRGIVERLATLIPGPLASMIFGAPAEDGTYSQTLNIRGGVILAGLVPAGMIPALF